ncbi:unnamed protein product [Closterium sp. NIES-64]|nr:unnamed protein product [Closterium sp. NIES-64]
MRGAGREGGGMTHGRQSQRSWCGEGGRWDDARQAVTAVCEPPGSLTPLSCKHPHTAKFPLPSPLPSLPLLFRVYHCPPEQQIKRGGMVMQGTQQRIPHRRAVRLADKRRAAFHSALTAALHRIHADFLAHVFPPAPQSQPTLHLHPSVPQSRRQASPVAAASGRGLRGEESQHGAVGAAEVGSEEKDEDEDEDEGSTVQRERRMKGKRRLETAGDDIEENGQGTEGDGKKQGRSGVKQSADSVAWHVDFPFEDISVSMLLAEAASFHSSQHTDAHTHAGQGRGGKGGKGKQQREAFVGRQSKQRRKGGAAGDESAKTGEVEEGAMEGGEGAEKGGKKRGDGGCGGDEGWDDETGIGAQRYTPPCPPRQLKKVPSCNLRTRHPSPPSSSHLFFSLSCNPVVCPHSPRISIPLLRGASEHGAHVRTAAAGASQAGPRIIKAALLSHLASSTPHDSCAAAARQSACQHRSTALLVLALTVCGSLCCCLQERAGSICCTGLAACRGVLALYAAPALLPAGACWLYMLHRPCCSKERQWREEAHGGAAVGWRNCDDLGATSAVWRRDSDELRAMLCGMATHWAATCGVAELLRATVCGTVMLLLAAPPLDESLSASTLLLS